MSGLTKPSSLDPGYSGGTKATTVIGAIIDSLNGRGKNVMDPGYGLTGDGVTDDYTNFSSLLSGSTAGDVWVIPPGRTIMIGSPLTVSTAGVSIYAPGATLKAGASFSTSADLLTFSSVTGGRVEGLTFDGNSRARWGLNTTLGTRLKIIGNTFTGCVIGIRHATGTYDTIEDNWCYSNSAQGIVDVGTSSNDSIGTLITGNHLYLNGTDTVGNLGWGINVSNYCRQFLVTNNVIYLPYQGGITVDVAITGIAGELFDTDGTVENNIIYGYSGSNASHGINTTRSDGLTIVGNQIQGQRQNGIQALGRKFEIAGNTLKANATGINASYVADVVAAPTVTLIADATGGQIDAGTHVHALAPVYAKGEGQLGTTSATITNDGTHTKTDVTVPALSSNILSFNIYRSLAGVTSPATWGWYQVAASQAPGVYHDIKTDAAITATNIHPSAVAWMGQHKIGPNTYDGNTTADLTVHASLVNNVEIIGFEKKVRKTSDQAWTSNATLADVTEMGFAVAANEVWEYEFNVLYDAGTTGLLQMAVTKPTGCFHWNAGAPALAGTVTTASGVTQQIAKTTSGAATIYGAAGTGTKVLAVVKGIARNGATAGTIQLQAAQSVSNGTATTIYTDSYTEARRIG